MFKFLRRFRGRYFSHIMATDDESIYLAQADIRLDELAMQARQRRRDGALDPCPDRYCIGCDCHDHGAAGDVFIGMRELP